MKGRVSHGQQATVQFNSDQTFMVDKCVYIPLKDSHFYITFGGSFECSTDSFGGRLRRDNNLVRISTLVLNRLLLKLEQKKKKFRGKQTNKCNNDKNIGIGNRF